jgi:hypothetical protein
VSGRITFAAIALFWVVMNVLLWRAEFGGGRETEAEIPIETVLERVLNAADDSVLTLRHHGQAIGQLRWNPSVIESAGDTNLPTNLPEGMVRTPTGHLLDLELNLFGDTPSSRWRVLTHLALETNHVWRDLDLRLIQRPNVWQFTAVRGEKTMHLHVEEGRTASDQIFALSDFANPMALMGPYATLLPKGLFPGAGLAAAPGTPAGLSWSARNDRLRVGHNRVRVYRVKVKLFDRFEGVAYFSRAGEVLKVTLPDNLVLVNEALPNLGHE